MTDLTTRIGSLTLANPIMPASGTFSAELGEVFDLSCLGALVTKTVTEARRGGNPTPRVCEIEGGMLNSIGIPSKGIDAFLRDQVPLWRDVGAPLVVSISADTAEDFARAAEKMTVPGVAAIEANISCPNIEADGHAFAMLPDTTFEAIARIRAATHLPLWAKLSPNTGVLREVARAAEAAGADALVTTNTALGLAIDVRTRRPKLGNVTGGISGPALKPLALRMTWQAASSVAIPVIGCGGIATRDDVLEFLIAGASAVQVGTATFRSPALMPRLIREIEEWCDAQGVARLADLVGSLAPADPAPHDLVPEPQS
ncbi:dihydroorotate dehydrogenase [Mesobaculum littorinae]|uniref:Dihydroorotate dehydrogenase n=1 Tax=Mesobaculum littorinae TaxID=2486419 RepID=A0A438AFE5_9RHOB|nr:dihydroorotate dehydrogenase [Mesobaculum littorinae]RVV97392.1 dihydroorotate dehydrogenase [Mesobaculum littorinae]